MKRLPHLLTALSLSLLPGLSFAATLQIKVSDRDGQVVPGAVVEVQTSSGALPPMSPPRQVTISQLKMKFVPRVTLVQPGVIRTPFIEKTQASIAEAIAAMPAEGVTLYGKGLARLDFEVHAVEHRPPAELLMHFFKSNHGVTCRTSA